MTREKKSVRLNVAFNAALHSKLVSEAEEKGLDVNDIIRNSVVEHFDRHASAEGSIA